MQTGRAMPSKFIWKRLGCWMKDGRYRSRLF